MNGWLTIKSLNFSYQHNKKIFDNFDLVVEKGEFLCLLGASGAGKSTLLKILMGSLQPQSGQITLSGEDLLAKESSDRGIGIVYQDFGLFDHLSVFDNVAFPLRAINSRSMTEFAMYRFSRESKKKLLHEVSSALNLVGLLSLADRMPRSLSGGEKQRVALARVLTLKPKLLCFDEPLASLDRKIRRELQAVIADLQESLGVATIYVTHDQQEGFSLASKIGLLRDGRIEQLDKPTVIYASPRNRAVASFIGECNFFVVRKINVFENLINIVSQDGVHLSLDFKDFDKKEFEIGSELGIWPENIRISSPTDSEIEVNGKIEKKVFYSGVELLHVKMKDQGTIKVRHLAQNEGMRIGDQIKLEFDINDFFLLHEN